jgi:PAS domain S-box-containing protein
MPVKPADGPSCPASAGGSLPLVSELLQASLNASRPASDVQSASTARAIDGPSLDRLKPWQADVFAVTVTAGTLWFRLAMDAPLGGRPTLVMFTLPIMLSAYVGGLRSGLLATALSYFGASYFLLPPIHSFAIASGVERWQQFFIVLAGVAISGLNEALHRARRRSSIAIREHQQAELAAARLAAIVESSFDAIIGKDLQSMVTSWNAAAESIFGYPADEMIGRSITVLIPPDRQDDEEKILARIRRGESVEHFETVRRRKDGGLIDVSVTVSPIKDATGTIIGASKVARDITEHKRAEESLHATQARLNSTLSAGSIGTWTWDIRNDSLTADEFTARAFSIEADAAAQGLPAAAYLQAVAEEDQPAVADGLARAIATCGHYDIEYRVRQKDGSFLWLQARGRVEGDAAGRAVSFHGAVMDITARKLADEMIQKLNTELEQRVIERTAQLESANKELEAFSYSVSHDLRAPLRAVDGFSQAVLEDYGTQLPPEGQRYLQTIRDGAQRMGLLIDDLLTFSRLSRAPLKKQEVQTGELVRGVLDDLSAQQEGRQIDLRLGELPACMGDPALLKQVWINLLANAFKYTGKRAAAVVEIGCRTQPGGTSISSATTAPALTCAMPTNSSVSSSGCTAQEDYEGTGVGLAIVQRIVHRHGGRSGPRRPWIAAPPFISPSKGETKP